jgi:septum formation protein
MAAPDLILASGSRFRRAMLEAAGVSLRVVPSDVDEPALRRRLGENNKSVDPADVAMHLARAKAVSVSAIHPAAVVIGADQVLELRGLIYAKPIDRADARNQLLQLRNATHTLPTACVIARDGQEIWTYLARPSLTMRDLSDAYIEHYLTSMGDIVTETVGGYQFEGLGAQLFDSIDGDYFSIIGLPLLPLLAELRHLGILPA